MRTHAAVTAAAMLLTTSAAVSDSMRCDKWVVDETATLAELLEKCGAPTSKAIAKDDVVARNAATGALNKVGTKVTERWLYQRGTRSLPMIVTIIDGKIQSIERHDP